MGHNSNEVYRVINSVHEGWKIYGQPFNSLFMLLKSGDLMVLYVASKPENQNSNLWWMSFAIRLECSSNTSPITELKTKQMYL